MVKKFWSQLCPIALPIRQHRTIHTTMGVWVLTLRQQILNEEQVWEATQHGRIEERRISMKRRSKQTLTVNTGAGDWVSDRQHWQPVDRQDTDWQCLLDLVIRMLVACHLENKNLGEATGTKPYATVGKWLCRKN